MVVLLNIENDIVWFKGVFFEFLCIKYKMWSVGSYLIYERFLRCIWLWERDRDSVGWYFFVKLVCWGKESLIEVRIFVELYVIIM